MIRIKINSVEKNKSGDDLSNFYGGSDIDMRLPDESPENQLPQAWALHMPNGEPMSNLQTATQAAPTNKGIDEELEFDLEENLLYEKKDRCYHLAKQKYDVFPSAYASGFIVRCRKGKVGRKRKKKVKINEEWSEEYKASIDCDNPKGFSQRAHCQGREKNEDLDLENVLSEIDFMLEEGTFDKEKSQGLHGWFARKGGKGKSKGWVDCNTCRTNPKTGRKTCSTCGRQSGEQRSKYPACRPTPSACTRRGTSQKRGPTRVSWGKKKQTEE